MIRPVLKLVTLLFSLTTGVTFAQTAMNFEMDDFEGNSHELFSYLNEGKSVVIDFFQYECGPCYSYHSTHELADFYNEYGPDGEDLAMVFQICTYDDATEAKLTGDNGGGWNWLEGVPYPTIVIDADVKSALLNHYMAWGTPTMVRICPDKGYDRGHPLGDGFGSAEGLKEWMGEACSIVAGVEEDVQSNLTLYPVPASNVITINGLTVNAYQFTIYNSLGQEVLSGNNITDATIDISELHEGMYVVTIMDGNNGRYTEKIAISR